MGGCLIEITRPTLHKGKIVIEICCTMEVKLGNETIVKTYSCRFDSEVIHRHELDQYFQRVVEEFTQEED